MTVHILGIRHHGPGSARSVKKALDSIQPDIVLVEGPPEGDAVLPLIIHKQMKPPVAMLVYAPDQPEYSVYYPFAVFSPEWQALSYGLNHEIPVRFIDLPQTHWLAIKQAEAALDLENMLVKAAETAQQVRVDPLKALAEAAGYADSERWWEKLVEQRKDSTNLFTAILEAMTALRDTLPPVDDPIEARREAHMRKMIRAAEREGHQNIAVICGAWHGPALATMPPEKSDNELLKGLPKLKVEATWVPWTYSRLMYASGYGAGIESPGWYEHLWKSPNQTATRWIVKVAKLLRGEDLDASTAQVIDALRLSESLASVRDNPTPGLPELSESIQAALCFGSAMPMKVIHHKLIIGEMLGQIPDDTPMVPLQQDLQRLIKRLRLKQSADNIELDLDLRQASDLDRSLLLHRLALLGIAWGRASHGSGKGTFHEYWTLQWKPEFAVILIERSTFGNTIRTAASGYARDLADNAEMLPVLTTLLNKILLCDLPDATVQYIMQRLQAQSALASNILHLMAALPPLAQIQRYGNVRQTDTSAISLIIDGLVIRICIGLPGACASLNNDAADEMFTAIQSVHSAITLLQNDEHLTAWYRTLRQLADQQGLHGLIAGRSCRILFDSESASIDEVEQRMSQALSVGTNPSQGAAWLEGFLKGSGLLLLHNDTLWQLIDSWLVSLTPDLFIATLPLLRRTFATFTGPERGQMADRVAHGFVQTGTTTVSENFDQNRAKAVLPFFTQLFGRIGEKSR
jgi:hypothetical protein